MNVRHPWEQVGSDLWQLRVYAQPAGTTPDRVLQWVLSARANSWDVQDGHGYVFAYGAGYELRDCQLRAYVALRAQLRTQLELLPL